MSKENLLQKIKDDTAEEIQRILSEANRRAEASKQESEETLRRFEQSELEKAEKTAKESEKQTRMLAEIEAKKTMLKAKREVIDMAVERANQKMLSLSDDEYIEWITTLIEHKASDGDQVVISKNDAKRITADLISEISAKTGKKITLNPVLGGFSGGIILTQNGCDKNMTLETALSEIEQDYILKISTKLFSNVE